MTKPTTYIPPSPWTPELDAELRRLWAEGHSGTAIGDAIGMTKNAVIGRAHRLKCERRPSPIGRTRATPPPPPPKIKAQPKPRPPLPVTEPDRLPPSDTSCRYIRNKDTRNPDYCPEPRLPEKAWCEFHFGRVYQPVKVTA